MEVLNERAYPGGMMHQGGQMHGTAMMGGPYHGGYGYGGYGHGGYGYDGYGHGGYGHGGYGHYYPYGHMAYPSLYTGPATNPYIPYI
jgi:hypothetical protein